MAQISYKPHALAGRLEYYLPWKGPGAALFNPASLAEAGIFQIDCAGNFPMTATPTNPFLQLAVGQPLGLSAGIAGHWNSSALDNSNAVYLESVYVPMLAFGWPASTEAKNRIAMGASFPLHHFNAFGAVRSYNFGMNLGILSIHRLPHSLGVVRAGFTILQLIQPEVRMPDQRGYYGIPREYDADLTWTLADGMFELHSGFFKIARNASEGPVTPIRPGIKSWGLEFNPTAWNGFKLEETATGVKTIGSIFRFDSMLKLKQRLEFNLSHDRLNAYDEGRGLLWSGALSAELR